jgi:hypothetical protein
MLGGGDCVRADDLESHIPLKTDIIGAINHGHTSQAFLRYDLVSVDLSPDVLIHKIPYVSKNFLNIPKVLCHPIRLKISLDIVSIHLVVWR